jgi:hypothetical protein
VWEVGRNLSGVIGETERGTPLNFALTTEGATDGLVPLRVSLPRLHQHIPLNR